MLGIFLAALDQTVVGTALPRIITDLRGNDALHVGLHGLPADARRSAGRCTASSPTCSAAARSSCSAVSFFLVGSVLCRPVAGDVAVHRSRGLQGLGAGALFPIALAIIGDLFAPSERGEVPGPVRRGLRAVARSSVRPSAASSPTTSAGTGSSSSTCRSVPSSCTSIWRLLPTRIEPGVTRRNDRLRGRRPVRGRPGAHPRRPHQQAVGEWTDPCVGGLIAIGLAFAVVFVWWESRAAEPIVPLAPLPASGPFTISVAGHVPGDVRLLRRGRLPAALVPGGPGRLGATESGYQILPLLAGLIVSAIVSGQIVARTGRYKVLIFGARSSCSRSGLFLLTNLRRRHGRARSSGCGWSITGLGVGPVLRGLHAVVQNGVPPSGSGVPPAA